MSNEIWTAVIVSFFVGLAVGYLILLTTNASAKKQQQLEKELQVAREQLQDHSQQLEKHFAESAVLLETMAQQYKQLYTHLATSAQHLLPETTQPEFFQANCALEDQNQVDSNTDNEQPKDYTEGSSGILKS